MGDPAYAKVQVQQKTVIGSSSKNSLLQRTCACGQHTHGGDCIDCRKKREGVLQRRVALSNEPTTVPPLVSEVLRSPGQPLDAGTRTFMEARFGHDFSQVRVHTDGKSAESARAVNALAYTVGQNVVFGQGQYSTATSSGRRLLAHELTHTVQQSQAGLSSLAGSMRVSEPSNADELEAEAVAERLISAGANETVVANIHPAASAFQRIGDPTKVPPGLELECEIASDSPLTPAENLLFGNDVFTLSSLQQAQIDNFVMNWQAAGGNAPVRVDGYTSTRGTDEFNWRLSCNRAEEVVNELTTPSSGALGIPAGFIRTVAQGETTEFGAEANNRRATISSPFTLPPAPACVNPGVSRTLDVQPVFLRTDPADASPTGTSWARRLSSANDIWGKIGVTFNDLGAITLDTPLKTSGTTAAERSSIRSLRSAGGVEVFLADNDLANVGGADTAPPIGAGCGANGNIVLSDRGASDTLLAHELGHILGLDHPSDPPPFNPGDANTIMEPSGSNAAANPTRNTMVNFNRILCPPPIGSTCLNPDP